MKAILFFSLLTVMASVGFSSVRKVDSVRHRVIGAMLSFSFFSVVALLQAPEDKAISIILGCALAASASVAILTIARALKI